MLAAYYDDTGPAHTVLQLGDVPTPEPAAGEVLVRVSASGINPTDTKVRGGAPGRQKPYPRIIPHHDGAGVIQDVGAGVPRDRIGTRVWTFCAQAARPFGTAAQYVALPQSLVAPLPDAVSFEVGAAIGIPCMTAFNAVLGDGPVAAKTILVAGGAGAVGNYAVQIARLSGARVISTVSSSQKAAEAETAGAHHVLNYRDPDVDRAILDITDGRGVDLFVDVDTTANAGLIGKVIALGGRVASYGSGGLAADVPVRDLRQKCVSIRFLTIHRFGPEVHGPMAAGINAMLERDALKHRIATSLPLERIADAHEMVEQGLAHGKVVLTID